MASEFEGAPLGDERRTKRLVSIAGAISAAPDRTIPQIARDDAELEAVYRLLNNDALKPEDMLEPHYLATAERARECKTTLVIHDITELSFPLEEDQKEGCGLLGSRQGFRLAPALALAGDESNRPLGLLNVATWVVEVSRKKRKGKKKRGNTWGSTPATKWAEFVNQSEAVMGAHGRLIHIMDREAGVYELFAELISNTRGFVIRMKKNRMVGLNKSDPALINIHEAAARLENMVEVEVPLSRRKPTYLVQRNPPRDARIARLGFAAARIRLERPSCQPASLAKSLDLNMVVVRELAAPEGEEPVEWLLATSEPIATADDVKRIVNSYRARWTIEEYFKALKTGCRIQSRQLESMAALERLLAIFLVVSWRILLLRQQSRKTPDEPATPTFSELQLGVLRATGRVPLPQRPTLRQALSAVAALGGHIKNNGDPGWHVLARGMESLLERTVGCVSMLRLFLGARKM